MSKASEWARNRPRKCPVGDINVSYDGDLYIPYAVGMAPERALQLRDWLTEVFDEPSGGDSSNYRCPECKELAGEHTRFCTLAEEDAPEPGGGEETWDLRKTEKVLLGKKQKPRGVWVTREQVECHLRRMHRVGKNGSSVGVHVEASLYCLGLGDGEGS